MAEDFYPEQYKNEPLYNIKAVEHATGLNSATLRAWERRYRVCIPQRNDSGYRLYSDRDIAALSWLKRRVDEGMAISQAVTLLHVRIVRNQPTLESSPVPPVSFETKLVTDDFSHASLREQLTHALLQFNELTADKTLSTAFAAHGVESTCELIIVPTMIDIGNRWHRGEVSIVVEHFATHYLRRKLENLVNATSFQENSPTIVLGCAPGDLHEIGLVLLAFFLRRQGYHVIYLGQNVPTDHLIEELKRLNPAMVILSATTEETAVALAKVSHVINKLPDPHPLFGFGGRIFNQHPELRSTISGHFLGESAIHAVNQINQLLFTAALSVQANE